MYSDEELLTLSGIQHFAFCRRQWALIHIEKRWQENYLTASGQVSHQRVHNEEIRERRGSVLVTRGLFVQLPNLGLSGVCDVVEFHRSENGVPLAGEEGTWLPVPIEYKRGRSKNDDSDRLQVCAQAMCLEEMLCCDIASGYLFYKQTQSREPVVFTDDLRASVRVTAKEMHELFSRGCVPRVRKRKACAACSLMDECLPMLQSRSVSAYIDGMLEESE